MGYDLYCEAATPSSVPAKDKYFRWNIFGWPPVLSLATMYGWEPEGTSIPRLSDEMAREHNLSKEEVRRHNEMVDDWAGEYYGNDGQIVSAQDAANMANAIEASLDDIPDFEIPIPGVGEDGMVSVDNVNYKKHRDALQAGSRAAYAVNYSGAKNKKYLRDFIKFLRLGEFSIN